jgi:hypothetical protein
MRFLASIPESLDSILQMEGILTCLIDAFNELIKA